MTYPNLENMNLHCKLSFKPLQAHSSQSAESKASWLLIYNIQEQQHHYFDAYKESKSWNAGNMVGDRQFSKKWFNTNMVIYNCSVFIKH